MNCEEISELLPAYVLGALEPDEMAAVEAHLRAEDKHDTELTELRATVFALDRYEMEVEPSPALAGRVAALVEAAPAVRSVPPPPKAGWFDRLGLRAALAAAAVVLAFALGLLAGGLMGGGDEVFALALHAEDGAFMEVRGSTNADSVTVTMAGLERLSGRSYQVWAVRDGDWQSMGVCNVNAEGGWVGDFPFQIQDGEAVALTIEPQDGSEQPTSEPIMRSWP